METTRICQNTLTAASTSRENNEGFVDLHDFLFPKTEKNIVRTSTRINIVANYYSTKIFKDVFRTFRGQPYAPNRLVIEKLLETWQSSTA